MYCRSYSYFFSVASCIQTFLFNSVFFWFSFYTINFFVSRYLCSVVIVCHLYSFALPNLLFMIIIYIFFLFVITMKKDIKQNKVQKIVQMFHFWIGFSSLYGAYTDYCKNKYLHEVFSASGQ